MQGCREAHAAAVPLQTQRSAARPPRQSLAFGFLGGTSAAVPPLLVGVRSVAPQPLRQASWHIGRVAAPTVEGQPVRQSSHRAPPTAPPSNCEGDINGRLPTGAARLQKGVALDERLFVPEPFRAAHKEEIGERRRKKLALLLAPEDAVQFKMVILVGEYIGSDATTFGRRIVVRHMPDVPLTIASKAWERVEHSYGAILQARDADVANEPRAMMAAPIYAKREHVYQVDTLSMMLTTDSWIPLEGPHGR